MLFETPYRLQSEFELEKGKILEDNKVKMERCTNSQLNVFFLLN